MSTHYENLEKYLTLMVEVENLTSRLQNWVSAFAYYEAETQVTEEVNAKLASLLSHLQDADTDAFDLNVLAEPELDK